MLHGGDITAALAMFGGQRHDWLDLSTGINPHAFPLPEIAPHIWQTLPAKAGLEALLAAARLAYAVPEEAHLIAAPGTQALIQWMPHLAPPGNVAILGPTYNEHARAFSNAGRRVHEIRDLTDWLSGSDMPNLVVVNPNNPDGRILSLPHLATLAAEAARRGGWLIIDESFIDIIPEQTAATLCSDHPVVILRSFGKFYGLAGVRLGFAVTSPINAHRFETALGPWAVGGPALAIGEIALAHSQWADTMRNRLRTEAAALDEVLLGGACTIIGGTALYRLVRHGNATALHDDLARHHRIWTRIFDWDVTLLRFGLPGSPADLHRLRQALRAFGDHASPRGITTSAPSTL